jgi:hypothetical protein
LIYYRAADCRRERPGSPFILLVAVGRRSQTDVWRQLGPSIANGERMQTSTCTWTRHAANRGSLRQSPHSKLAPGTSHRPPPLPTYPVRIVQLLLTIKESCFYRAGPALCTHGGEGVGGQVSSRRDQMPQKNSLKCHRLSICLVPIIQTFFW